MAFPFPETYSIIPSRQPYPRKFQRTIDAMKDLYKVAIDAAIIFSETDTTGTILSINDLFCTRSGYSRHELIGQNHRLVNSQHHPTSFYHDIWMSIANGSIWRGQICNRAKDGALYWVHCTIIPILASEPPHCQKTKEQSFTSAVCKEPRFIQKYISVSFDITAQIELMHNLQRQASYDSLTGLPNRTLLAEHVNKKISSTHLLNRRPSFAVGLLDMNHFKLINDTYGHDIGDKLLIETARRLEASFRQEDMVARLGGDEFVIVWNDAGIIPDRAFVSHFNRKRDAGRGEALRGVLDRVFGQPYSLGDGVSLDNIKGSLGIALYPDHGLDLETLLRHADQAMYQAKSKGGCVCIFNWGLKGKKMGRL